MFGQSAQWTMVLISSALFTTSLPTAEAQPVPQSEYYVIRGYDAPQTPEWLDVVAYMRHWTHPPTASPDAVLILIPGYLGGAEDFRYVGARLVTRLPWLEVWAADRRSNFLENRFGMELAQMLGSAQLAAAYYLAGIDIPGLPPHVDPDPLAWNGLGAEFAVSQPEARSLGMGEWGLETALGDVRALVARTHALYPAAKVFLGGHSLGGMTAQIYAGWRFGEAPRTAGWHDIDGLVLIDGGVDGPNWESVLLGQYTRDLDLMATGSVFWDDLSEGISPTMGHLAEIVAMAASFDPAAESLLWRSLPPPFAWSNPFTAPTNKALFAAFTDDQYGFSGTFRLHQGDFLGPIGITADGRFIIHWSDYWQTSPPELSSTDAWARALWQHQATNGVEWYFPIRLNAELDLAGNLDSHTHFRHPVTGESVSAARLEGQRAFDTKRVAVPVYAFAAAQGRARFEWYLGVARKISSFTLIDRSDEHTPHPSSRPYSHLDPLFAADTGGFTNDFLATLADWLASNRSRCDDRRRNENDDREESE